MQVRVITAPAPVVSLELAKQHLSVDHDDDDLLIEGYLQAATGTIDGPDGWLGRALGVQTLEARLDALDCELIELPCRPLVEILFVNYDDQDGVEQTLAPDQYSLDPVGLLRAYGVSYPAPRRHRGSVRIRYVAGYGEAALPAPIRSAILLMTGDLYANRETVAAGAVSTVNMSVGVERLLSPFRVWKA